MTTLSGPSYDLTKTSTTTQATTTSTKKSTELGKDQFLQLMVKQLQYQDPLNPTDNQQFLAQMAQFSALEQMQNLNTSFTSTKALGLVGKYVEGTITGDGSNQLIQGNVDSVKISGSSAFAVVNGAEVPVDSITVIKQGTATDKTVDLSKYAGFINKNAKAFVSALTQNQAYQVTGAIGGIKIAQGQNNSEVPVAILNGVNAKIATLDGAVQLGSGTVKDYLLSNIGKVITATVVDGLGVKSKMTGTISAASGDDTNPNVVFDGVNTAIDSIYQVGE